MILDLLEYFDKASEENKNKLILDNHTLKNGLYIEISEKFENSIKSILHVNNIKGSINEKIIYNPGKFKKSELVKNFIERDYISSLISTNKAIDLKKTLHSNNYLTAFFKYDNLDKVFEISLDNFYNAFKTKFAKKHIQKILKAKEINEIDLNEFDKVKNMIFNLQDDIKTIVKENELKKGDYIKLFYDDSDINYNLENNRYLYSNIFNSNDYNITSKNITLGSSNINTTLNSGKPFLLHRTTNFKVPSRITLKQGLDGEKLLKFFYDSKETVIVQDKENKDNSTSEIKTVWNGILALNTSIEDNDFKFKTFDEFENQLGYVVNIKKEKDSTIFIDLDFNPTMPPKFEILNLVNYLDINLKENNNYRQIKSRKELINYMNDHLFDRLFYKDIKTIYNRNYIKSLISTTRKTILDYLNLNNSKNFISILDNLTLNLTLEKIQPSAINSLKENNSKNLTSSIENALNARLNLLSYFKIGGKENMGQKLIELHKNFLENINRKENLTPCQNDTEFYFATGQIVYYLISLSKSDKLNLDIMNNIINSKNPANLKKHIERLHLTYAHAIGFRYYRYQNLLSFIMNYDPECQKIFTDIFLAGFSTKPNAIYQKIEKDDDIDTVIEGDV